MAYSLLPKISAKPTPSIFLISVIKLISAKLYKKFTSRLVSLLVKFTYINILDSSLDILIPSFTTCGGSLLFTAATLFCTFTEAILGSVPNLNTTVIKQVPSLPASDAIYFTPGTPFKALSNGITTALIISSALAPGYSATIFTLGGEIEGNCVTGNCIKDNTPNSTITNDITIENTGLLISFLIMFFSYFIDKASFAEISVTFIFSSSFAL